MVQIDRGTQTMAVTVDGISRYAWRVSTGRAGFGTPSGIFPSAVHVGALVLAQIL